MKTRIFSRASWWQWCSLAISALMTAEYARLVLTTEVAAYRYLVLLVWAGMTLFFLARIVRSYSGNQNNIDVQTNESNE